MTSKYTRLARAEKAAEQASSQAATAFGKAWWETGLALAGCPNHMIGTVYEEILPILGQTRKYVGERRSLAQLVAPEVIESGAVYDLPPRLCLEWMRVQGRNSSIDPRIASDLIRYEKEGVSLRELRGILGSENPPSWHSKDEREAAMEGIRKQAYSPEQLRAAMRNPDVRREVVRNVGEDRALARDLAMNGKATGSIRDARREAIRDRLAKDNLHPGRRDPDFDTPIELATALAELVKSRISVKAAYRAITDTPMTAEVRESLMGAIAPLEDAIEALRRRVEGDEVDAALARIMESAE